MISIHDGNLAQIVVAVKGQGVDYENSTVNEGFCRTWI